MERIDAIEAGRQVRARLEADRRRRGVSPQGVVFPGETADYENPANQGPKGPLSPTAAAARMRERARKARGRE